MGTVNTDSRVHRLRFSPGSRLIIHRLSGDVTLIPWRTGLFLFIPKRAAR